MATVAERQRAGLGAISADRVYPKGVFLRLSGMSQAAWDSAIAAGLPVRRHGRRSYVLGSEWAQFLARQRDESAPAAR